MRELRNFEGRISNMSFYDFEKNRIEVDKIVEEIVDRKRNTRK